MNQAEILQGQQQDFSESTAREVLIKKRTAAMILKESKEKFMNAVFFVCGMAAVACVALITVYIFSAGLPAIQEIGLSNFLLGKVWKSTAAEPSYGILPFILTSVYGTVGACIIGVPVGVLTAVFGRLSSQVQHLSNEFVRRKKAETLSWSIIDQLQNSIQLDIGNFGEISPSREEKAK